MQETGRARCKTSSYSHDENRMNKRNGYFTPSEAFLAHSFPLLSANPEKNPYRSGMKYGSRYATIPKNRALSGKHDHHRPDRREAKTSLPHPIPVCGTTTPENKNVRMAKTMRTSATGTARYSGCHKIIRQTSWPFAGRPGKYPRPAEYPRSASR